MIVACTVLVASTATFASENFPPQTSFSDSIDRVQSRMIKIYGVGGLSGLESYQSGFLISADGYVLTVWSTVLDATDDLLVTLDDGRKFKADFLGADPRLEIAVLKVDATDLPHFDLAIEAIGRVGTRILAFSNLYRIATGDEPASVQRGVVAATTNLAARRGVFKSPYQGPVYVVDAVTNNPGAAGGALTTIRGELLGMLGKELRNSRDNTWLNYALPISELRNSVAALISGQAQPQQDELALPVRNPVDLEALGIIFVPDVVDNTPPFIDSVRSGSAADRAGIRRDDLVLFIESELVQSLDDVDAECKRIERGQILSLTLRRGEELKVVELATNPPREDPK